MLRFLCLLAAGLVLSQPAAAAGTADAGTPGLPGGASSLQESYDNWTVGCRIQTANGSSHKLCTMTQVQTDKSSGQRVLEIDVEPAPSGAVVTLILPFGLALPQGVRMQVDTADPGPVLPFATCLPVGCVVRSEIGDRQLTGLRTGTTLKLKTVAASGAVTDFAVPLKGFAGAIDRMAVLLK